MNTYTGQMPIHVSQHPLVLSKLTQLRLHDLPAKDFREGIKAIGWVVFLLSSLSFVILGEVEGYDGEQSGG